MRKLLYLIVTFFLGVLIGAGGLYYAMRIPPAGGGEDVVTTHISGAKIIHRNFDVDRKKMSFVTEAEGKGAARTEIPLSKIPQARAWLEYKNAVQVTGALEWQNGFFGEYGVMYWRRFGRISLGAGVRGSQKSAALEAGFMVWF